MFRTAGRTRSPRRIKQHRFAWSATSMIKLPFGLSVISGPTFRLFKRERHSRLGGSAPSAFCAKLHPHLSAAASHGEEIISRCCAALPCTASSAGVFCGFALTIAEGSNQATAVRQCHQWPRPSIQRNSWFCSKDTATRVFGLFTESAAYRSRGQCCKINCRFRSSSLAVAMK